MIAGLLVIRKIKIFYNYHDFLEEFNYFCLFSTEQLNIFLKMTIDWGDEKLFLWKWKGENIFIYYIS